MKKWSEAKRLAFKIMAPGAVALVATNGPVSVVLYDRAGYPAKRYGHNRGIWPAKIARTAAWKETVTATYDKDPFLDLGLRFRVWAATIAARDQLAEAVVELIERRAEADGGLDELRNGFYDLGPDLDLAMFEMEIHDLAKRLGITAWDDDGLEAHLEFIEGRARTIALQHARPLPLDRRVAMAVENATRNSGVRSKGGM